MRTWLLLTMVVGCGGKTVDGDCAPNQDGGWSCVESTDGASLATQISECQASDVASDAQCGPLGSECFTCDGITGTLWACEIHLGMMVQYTQSIYGSPAVLSIGFWTAAGTYSCQQ